MYWITPYMRACSVLAWEKFPMRHRVWNIFFYSSKLSENNNCISRAHQAIISSGMHNEESKKEIEGKKEHDRKFPTYPNAVNLRLRMMVHMIPQFVHSYRRCVMLFKMKKKKRNKRDQISILIYTNWNLFSLYVYMASRTRLLFRFFSARFSFFLSDIGFTYISLFDLLYYWVNQQAHTHTHTEQIHLLRSSSCKLPTGMRHRNPDRKDGKKIDDKTR